MLQCRQYFGVGRSGDVRRNRQIVNLSGIHDQSVYDIILVRAFVREMRIFTQLGQSDRFVHQDAFGHAIGVVHFIGLCFSFSEGALEFVRLDRRIETRTRKFRGLIERAQSNLVDPKIQSLFENPARFCGFEFWQLGQGEHHARWPFGGFTERGNGDINATRAAIALRGCDSFNSFTTRQARVPQLHNTPKIRTAPRPTRASLPE